MCLQLHVPHTLLRSLILGIVGVGLGSSGLVASALYLLSYLSGSFCLSLKILSHSVA